MELCLLFFFYMLDEKAISRPRIMAPFKFFLKQQTNTNVDTFTCKITFMSCHQGNLSITMDIGWLDLHTWTTPEGSSGWDKNNKNKDNVMVVLVCCIKIAGGHVLDR